MRTRSRDLFMPTNRSAGLPARHEAPRFARAGPERGVPKASHTSTSHFRIRSSKFETRHSPFCSLSPLLLDPAPFDVWIAYRTTLTINVED